MSSSEQNTRAYEHPAVGDYGENNYVGQIDISPNRLQKAKGALLVPYAKRLERLYCCHRNKVHTQR